MKKNFIIISDNLEVFSNPTICSFIEILIKRNNKVYIIAPKQVLHCPFDSTKIKFIHRHDKSIKYILWSLLRNIVSTIKSIRDTSTLKDIYWEFRKNLNASYADCIDLLSCIYSSLCTIIKYKLYYRPHYICIDDNGLLLSENFRIFAFGYKLTYFSFEITFGDECKNSFRKWHRYISSSLMKRVSNYLIQDEIRNHNLLEENGYLRNKRKFIIPVAPKLILFTRSILKRRTSIIFSGSFNKCMGIHQVFKHIHSYSNDYFFEFHTHRPDLIDDQILSFISNNKSQNIKFHLEAYTEIESYYSYLSQFHCAISLYFSNPEWGIWMGKNIADIGLSSGKFATFMMLGIPTIVRDIEPYTSIYKKYKFGSLITHLSEIGSAISNIIKNHNAYCEASTQLYHNILFPFNNINQKFLDIVRD